MTLEEKRRKFVKVGEREQERDVYGLVVVGGARPK